MVEIDLRKVTIILEVGNGRKTSGAVRSTNSKTYVTSGFLSAIDGN